MLSSTVLLITATLLLLGAGFAQTTMQATKSQCAAYYPQYCSDGKCDAPECEIYADGSGSLLLAPGGTDTDRWESLRISDAGPSSPWHVAKCPEGGCLIDHSQDLPEAPKPAGTCGPSWLGGCWDVHAPRRSNWGVVTDPYFVWPTVADALVTSLDGAVTAYGLGHSPCLEHNNDLGRNPSDAKIAGVNALIFGVTTGFRFVALKAIPKDSHSRWVWIPRAFSIGTAARSAQVHVRGAMSWFSSGCL